MKNKYIKGLTISKNLVTLGLLAMSFMCIILGVKLLISDLSYISLLELIQYSTYGAGVLIIANAIKSIKIK